MTRDRLDTLIARSGSRAPHMLPLLHAVRDNGLRLIVLPQTGESFLKALTEPARPFVALIADDTDQAVGPGHYHQGSLRRLASVIGSGAVISSAPPVDAFAAMTVMPVVFGVNTVIVETRPEQEIPWINALRQVQPDLPLIVATVHGGHA
jgi:hypothetical protein